MYVHNTIAAVATPPGTGGVGIVRVSGDQALALSKQLFKAGAAGKLAPQRLYFGDFSEPGGAFIDSGYFVWFRAPRSFTGEEVAEFHCHGGVVVLQMLLAALYRLGAKPAEPGEFSKRAFLNGKIDLAQAEAISDLISASTSKAVEIAQSHYRGKLSQAIEQVREELISVLAWIEAEIDYPEAEIDFAGEGEAKGTLLAQIDALVQLQKTYREGRIYQQGVATVILGSPNVGKSSLLNLLTGEERAIVTAIPGTTRDVLEVAINIRGIPLRLADTAGIRESADAVERIGIKKARKAAEQADLILLVLDTSRSLSDADKRLLADVPQHNCIVVLNKTDLPAMLKVTTIRRLGFTRVREISALQEQGIEGLKDEIEQMFVSGQLATDATLVSNQRHFQALVATTDILRQVSAEWETLPQDLLALDLRQGWETLGQITGAVWTEDLLDSIFKRFCLGK